MQGRLIQLIGVTGKYNQTEQQQKHNGYLFYSMTEEQYMQSTIQLSSHRTIFQWLRRILTIDGDCTREEELPVLTLIQNLENLITVALIQEIPGRCASYMNRKNLFMGLRWSPCLRATLDGD